MIRFRRSLVRTFAPLAVWAMLRDRQTLFTRTIRAAWRAL